MDYYIDVNNAAHLGCIGEVTVKLHGKRVHRCVAAKSGTNGFVEYQEVPVRGSEEMRVVRKRGNVKISFNKSEGK